MAVQIALSRGLFAVVDDEDFPLVCDRKWFAMKSGRTNYAVCGGLPMHRLLMKVGVGVVVDHINGDGLDNRRANLRVCSHKENLRNRRKQNGSSRFKGVFIRPGGKWTAEIQQNGVKLKLGVFASEIGAARQYDRAARVFFGAFAKTNEMLGLFDGAQDRVWRKPRRINIAA